LNFFSYIEQHKFSILGTIAVHIILLVWFNLTIVIHKPYETKERVVMRLDFSETESENLPEDNEQGQGETTSELTNVVANANQEETSYTNQQFSKSRADQEVLDALKQLEADEYKSIEHAPENEAVPNEDKAIDPNLVKTDAKENENASYGNDVMATASYFLKNRSPQRKPTPSYKCTSEGTVVVNIKVNQKGRVIASSIDESKTNTQNDCLRNEAVSYAKRWKFTQDFNDNARKSGWIKFSYVAQ